MKTLLLSLCLLTSGLASAQKHDEKGKTRPQPKFEVNKPDSEWKSTLTIQQYLVLRKKATERAYTGVYDTHHEPGTYCCAGCGNKLFSSDHKFQSGTGWPSFYQPFGAKSVITEADHKPGIVRQEVLCARCGGHLGHVFDDGPQPTGLRYCINSAALLFTK